MDDPALAEPHHHAALRALARINRISASVQIVWRPIQALARRHPRPLSVLDVACGGGDVPIGLQNRARRAGIALQVAGCDISSRTVEFARRSAAERRAPVHFFEHDVLSDPLPDEYDVIMSSLFLHHLENDTALQMLRSIAKRTQRLVLINDLDRSRLGYALARCVSQLITRSRVVHVDAPLSVRAAFTKEEAADLAESAGLSDARVQRRWPCRWLLSWSRS